MSGPLPWQAFVGRCRPATAREERALVAELVTRSEIAAVQESSGAVAVVRSASSFAKDLTLVAGTGVDRDVVTLLMLALRSGVSSGELFDLAVSADPRELMAAYRLVEQRRAEAEVAWYDALADAADGVVSGVLEGASVLMPSACRSLLDSPAASRYRTAAGLERRVRAAHRVADMVEQLMDHPPAAPQMSMSTLGRRLYDPYFGGLWHHPLFLPRRVGELTPPRLSALLGEDPR